MKKILAIILATLMLVSIVACDTNDNDNEETSSSVVDNNGNEDNGETNNGGEETPPANDNIIFPDVDSDTLGYLYFEKLVEVKTANPDATSMDVIEAIMNSSLVYAFPGAMPMAFEPDTYLMGLGKDGATFGGFVSSYALIPMMMGQPFVVYVFDLAADADVAAFVESVKTNANPAWNVCTTAETVTVGSCGNLVVLAMCQKAIPSLVSGIADIIEPEVAEGSEVANIFSTFKTVMETFETPEIWSEDVASALIAAGVEGEATQAEDTIVNDHFLYEVNGWGASKITNGEKLIYIFQLEMGTDVVNWTDYNCATKEGADLSFGSYNGTVIVFVNFN